MTEPFNIQDIKEKAKKALAQDSESVKPENTAPDLHACAQEVGMALQGHRHCPSGDVNVSEMPTLQTFGLSSELEFGADTTQVTRSANNVNINPSVKAKGILKINEISKTRYNTSTELSTLTQTIQIADSNAMIANFIDKEYPSYFSAANSSAGEVVVSEYHKKESTMLTELKSEEIVGKSQSVDIYNYRDNPALLDEEIRQTAANNIEKLGEQLEYKMLISDSLATASSLAINKYYTANDRAQIKSFQPILATSSDFAKDPTLFVSRDVTVANSRFFDVQDYNNMSYHRFGTHFEAKMKFLPGTLQNAKLRWEDFLMLKFFFQYFASTEHQMHVNKSRREYGKISGKPIVRVCPALYNAISSINKFSVEGTNASNSNEFAIGTADEIFKYVDVQMMSALEYKDTNGVSTYTAGDVLGYIAYPNCYLKVDMIQNYDYMLQFNKMAQKIGKDQYMEYRQTAGVNENGFGKVDIRTHYKGMGFIPTPFAKIQLTFDGDRS
jgi:hypothetical protein